MPAGSPLPRSAAQAQVADLDDQIVRDRVGDLVARLQFLLGARRRALALDDASTSALRPSSSVTSSGETAKVVDHDRSGRGSIWPSVSIWLWVEVQALTKTSPKKAHRPERGSGRARSRPARPCAGVAGLRLVDVHRFPLLLAPVRSARALVDGISAGSEPQDPAQAEVDALHSRPITREDRPRFACPGSLAASRPRSRCAEARVRLDGTRSLHQLDLARPPVLGEERLERAVEAQDREPALAGHRSGSSCPA